MDLYQHFTCQDTAGNQCNYSGGDLILTLHNGEVRHIGKIEETDTGLVYYKDIKKRKHLLRVNNSCGIAHEVIKRMADEDDIWIRLDKKQTYHTTVKTLKAKGSFMKSFNTKYERQLFLPLHLWEKVD